jgi:hypothetical protein
MNDDEFVVQHTKCCKNEKSIEWGKSDLFGPEIGGSVKSTTGFSCSQCS